MGSGLEVTPRKEKQDSHTPERNCSDMRYSMTTPMESCYAETPDSIKILAIAAVFWECLSASFFNAFLVSGVRQMVMVQFLSLVRSASSGLPRRLMESGSGLDLNFFINNDS